MAFKAKPKPREDVFFVLLNPRKAKYSFSAYTSRDGMLQYLWNRKDDRNKPLWRRFEFSRGYRSIRVPAAQVMFGPGVDSKGQPEKISVVDFLKNHPECEGSPNNTGQKIMFKLMDDGKDAEIAISARKKKNEAENLALSLEGQKLKAVAVMIGYKPATGYNEAIATHSCLEAAARDPEYFIGLANDESTMMRSFIKEAITSGVVSKKGEIILWGKVLLGNDEEEASGKLISDEQLYRGIKAKMEKLGK